MSALAQALLAFQKSAPAIQKNALNPHFRNRYVSLEELMGEVVPKLNEAGLIVTQAPTAMVVSGGEVKPALRTSITHAESGESLEDVMLLMPEKEGPQAQGSALTYARRYALMSMLGLVADEDDDGNKASGSAAGSRTGTDEPGSSGSAAVQSNGSLLIHFGKNKGTALDALSDRQLEWYATQWQIQDDPSEYDHALKAAAVKLLSERRNLDEIPFA